MTRLPFQAATLVGVLALSACNTEEPFDVTLELVDRHASGLFDEGAAEIVAYHPDSQHAFVTNAQSGTLDKISLKSISSTAAANPTTVANLLSERIPLPASITLFNGETLHLGGANSVAISKGLMAVAMEAEVKQDNGAILFYSLGDHGEVTYQKAVKAGALPDMVTFSPNGKLVLVANEGEPNGNYTVDPEGSITVITIIDGTAQDEGTQLDFHRFNEQLEAGVLVGNNPAPESTTVSQDLEPEYITVTDDNQWAFVSLQENNALAKIRLTGQVEITNVYALGLKDHRIDSNSLDADKDDEAAVLTTQPGLLSRYQPDSIASYTVKGKHFVVTANEGDSREYIDDNIDETECNATAQQDIRTKTTYLWDDACIVYKDEWKIKDLNDAEAPHASATFSVDTTELLSNIEDLTVSADLGYDSTTNEYQTLAAFGGRSFSIFDDQGTLVFDSGNDFERITAERFPEAFNSSNTKTSVDNRSDNKGPEPEALTLAEINGHTLAIIGLERMGGLMMYDITDPQNVHFIEYVNHRDYQADPKSADAGDLAPEGLKFVAAEYSPSGKPLVLVANEVSGTLAVYQLSVHK